MLLLSRYLYSWRRSRFFLMIPCDVTACRGDYERTALGSQSSSELIDWNDFGVSSAVRAGKPGELLKVLLLLLLVNCCLFVLRICIRGIVPVTFATCFSCIFVNKP
ncbi:hypothetical protein AVEN_25887-1 [Araneus ventricosus]|uniref:Uncharacterized protein n=1 Tax=Araneus ventricosus TaxID=182803 RepID=A0A4Y2FBY9_ARAVE|nr:hypothetical protein AVEN_25887-1 [Araneus ventricosus]